MNRQQIQALDRQDPLARKRQEFHLPEGVIYLDGNSLGALPRVARERAREVVERQWGQDLISSWNRHHWIDLPIRVGDKIAALIGAAPGQVICCDSTSVNLFKLLGCALALRPDRQVILSRPDNFPADLYMIEGMLRSGMAGTRRLDLAPEGQLESALDESVAVLLLTHVNFRTGQRYDMQRLTRLAHDCGALVIWDLAHTAGAMPVALDDWQVDFAVGCGYKYLNGGPGAPAFLYAAARHHDRIAQPLTGWMGHMAPFAFETAYRPATGITQFLCGTPPVVSMSILDAALEVFADVTMDALRAKSMALGEVFLELVQADAALAELTLASPPEAADRGSQLAFAHDEAYAICQALIARGMIADFRAPDVLRFGFAPLYISYMDILHSVEALSAIMAGKLYQRAQYRQRQKVT